MKIFTLLTSLLLIGSGEQPQEDLIIKMGGGVRRNDLTGEIIRVDLRDTQISNDDLAVVKDLENLTILLLNNTPITDAGLEHIKNLASLTSLDLTDTNITDRGIEHLKALKELKSLSLFNTQITDAGLVHLKALSNLRTLSIGDTQTTDAGLQQVSGLVSLTALAILNTNATDAGLEHVANLTKLQQLYLNNTQVTDDGLANLKDLKGLTYLNLENTAITDAGLEHLRHLPSLKLLSLHRNSQITDAALLSISRLTNLKAVELRGTSVTEEVLAKIKVALPNCRVSGSEPSYARQSQPRLEPRVVPTLYKVIKIVDGDTIDVLTSDRETIRLRFNAIDTPERGQPFGNNATKFVSDTVGGKMVRLVTHGKDSYGRTIADIYLPAEQSRRKLPDLFLNRELVTNGLAWHYKFYSDDQQLAADESNARRKQLGLWAGSHKPVAPWDWRKLSKEERGKLR